MDQLIIYTMYERPIDYPQEVVVRRHFVDRSGSKPEMGEPFIRAKTIEEARKQLPMGLTCLGREQEDEPQF